MIFEFTLLGPILDLYQKASSHAVCRLGEGRTHKIERVAIYALSDDKTQV